MLDRSFSWHGDTIRWRETGEGPPLWLCHGTPWSAALWEPIADALAVEHTVHL